MPRLSIIIVTYNSRADLDGCLGALAGHPPATTHEVVVVDNASTDGTADFVREHWPAVRVIEAGSNLGYAKANNRAIRDTRSELVLLLNPDTVAGGEAIDGLVDALDEFPAAAIVGPRIVDMSGRAELSFGRRIMPLAELRQRVLVRGNDRGFPLIVAWVDHLTRQTGFVDWVTGACLLIRRADLEAVNLLDERFFMYLEDVDLCAAVQARGRSVLFVSETQIVHARGTAAAASPRATEHAYRRSQIAFYQKHLPQWVPLLRMYLKIRGRLPDTSRQGQ